MKSFLPSDSGNFSRMVIEVLKSGDRAAYSAMFQSALGILAVPADLLMAGAEKNRYSDSPDPSMPILFVCGPPRSGTTLVAQVLIHGLHSAYFNNLAAVFPRSPISANRFFEGLLRRPKADFHAFYGKTRGLGAVNDGLQLWDRWIPGDRNAVPGEIMPESAQSLRRFFGAWERHSGLPLINKNNRLNTYSDRVAPLLPTAYFVCLERAPLYLAQSLLVARQKITGDPNRSYGILPAGLSEQLAGLAPESSVAKQVAYYAGEARRQSRVIAGDRFRIFGYEDFCRDPRAFVEEISAWTGIGRRVGAEVPDSFAVREKRTVGEESFAALELAVAAETLSVR